MFAFPGIWRRYQGPIKKDGPKVDIEVFAFLTTSPNKLVATINHERMPVLLTREEEFDVWLEPSDTKPKPRGLTGLSIKIRPLDAPRNLEQICASALKREGVRALRGCGRISHPRQASRPIRHSVAGMGTSGHRRPYRP